jgi:hypothetical protein
MAVYMNKPFMAKRGRSIKASRSKNMWTCQDSILDPSSMEKSLEKSPHSLADIVYGSVAEARKIRV